MVIHTSATGAGHCMAAKALVDALQEHPVIEAESKAAVRGNPLVGAAQVALMAVKALFSPEALAHIQEVQPDLIVSTQAEASQMLAHWKRRGMWRHRCGRC